MAWNVRIFHDTTAGRLGWNLARLMVRDGCSDAASLLFSRNPAVVLSPVCSISIHSVALSPCEADLGRHEDDVSQCQDLQMAEAAPKISSCRSQHNQNLILKAKFGSRSR